MASIYRNVLLVDQGQAYRVAFQIDLDPPRPMICARKTRHGEALLWMHYPRSKKIISLALSALENAGIKS